MVTRSSHRRSAPVTVATALAVLLGALHAAPAAAQATRLETLRDEARANRRDAEAQTEYGLALLRAGRYDEAQRVLKRAARLKDNSLEALYDVARVAFARGDYDRARRACRPLRRKARDAPLTDVCFARAFLVWNRSARAFDKIDAALEKDPDHFEALVARGDAYRLRAEADKAEEAYRKAAEVRPDSAKPHLGLGRLYVAVGRRSDAVDALRKAHELDGDSPAVQYQLGRLLGTSDEARKLLKEAVAGRPDWADPHAALATVLRRDGEMKAAAEHYRKALELDEDLVPAHVGLARSLMALGKYDKAHEKVQHALELVPNSQETVLTLARVYEKKGENEDALEQYGHAADLDPTNPEPLLEATRLALRLDRDVLAAGFLDRLLGRHERLAAALALYGDVMRIRGERAKAKKYYRRALKRGRGPLERRRVRQALSELDEAPEEQEELEPAMVDPR